MHQENYFPDLPRLLEELQYIWPYVIILIHIFYEMRMVSTGIYHEKGNIKSSIYFTIGIDSTGMSEINGKRYRIEIIT